MLAWAVGLGIFTWRTVQQYRKPPVPGRILGASAVFAALALLAEYEPARRAATLAAWGFDVAVLFKAGPAQLTQGAGWVTGTNPLGSNPPGSGGGASNPLGGGGGNSQKQHKQGG